jgi:peroxiredoxin
MSGILSPGTKARDFALKISPDQELSLGDLLGKPIVLAFYPADWSPVCGDQMNLYNQVSPEFRNSTLNCSIFRGRRSGLPGHCP